MEAASQALAIVATDFAGIPEFIRSGVEGELVPPGDWEALSNALNLLARDPERRKALGRRGLSRLRTDFSMEGGIDVLGAALPARDATHARESRSRCEPSQARCVLCPAEEPEPSLALGRPHHGAPAHEGPRPRQAFAPSSQASCGPSTRRATGSARSLEAAIARRGRAPHRALSGACRRTSRPRLWFTYHVYYKAPDWIGPRVARGLGIPYVVAEGSRAAKRAQGPWALGHAGAEAALDRADCDLRDDGA